MATERVFVCADCGHKEWFTNLFEALKEISIGHIRSCVKCEKKMHLELIHQFGLDAGTHTGKVLDAFLPIDIVEWERADGATVKFYPFLVMVESVSGGYISGWLPYWHVVFNTTGSVERKYGQWAPFMGVDSLASLLEQARKRGYEV